MSRYNEILQKVKFESLNKYLNDGKTIIDTKEIAAKLYAEECVKASLEKAKNNTEELIKSNEVEKIHINDFLKIKETIINPENIILL